MGYRGPRAAVVCISSLFFILISTACYGADYEGRLVGLVEVQGNHWIDAKTVLHTVQTAPGKTFSSRLIRKDLKSLYRLGFFENVIVEVEERPEVGLTVIYKVVEKPLITEIVITGNKKIGTEKLRERLTVRTRTILDEAKIKRNATLLENEYKINGYQDVTVEPVYEKTREKIDMAKELGYKP